MLTITTRDDSWVYNEESGVLYAPQTPTLRIPVAFNIEPKYGHLIADTMNAQRVEGPSPSFEEFKDTLEHVISRIPAVERAAYYTNGTTDIILREDVRSNLDIATELQKVFAIKGYPCHVTTVFRAGKSSLYEIRMEETPR